MLVIGKIPGDEVEIMATANTQVRFISRVLERRTSQPQDAMNHFQSKLTNETDPSDVYYDLQNGESGFMILDARSAEAFAQGHVPGAISMPHRKINEAITANWPKDKPIVAYCYSPACNAAAKAAVKLISLGFTVKEMIGGVEYWKEEGYPLQKQGEPAVFLNAPVVG
jgi:rhodanese-related sulfurtransferase